MIQLTPKQIEALGKLRTGITRLLLYGGSRSGKTLLFVCIILLAAMKFPGSRHLIARLRFNHAKKTIWKDTLKKAMRLLEIPEGSYSKNESDYVVTFANGSEVWIDGLDDKDRVEKILGSEYSIIFLNEVSQISYDSVLLVLTRLSLDIPGLRNMLLCDENPPSPRHWSHRLFIERVDPKSAEDEEVKYPEEYAYLLLNPMDNAQNLAKNYIERNLESLPKRARDRFLLGLFTSPENIVYGAFDESMIIDEDHDLLKDLEELSAGTDFGLHMAGVLIGWVGDTIIVLDDCGGYNLTTAKYNEMINAPEKWGQFDYMNACDPAGGERLQEITNSVKANNSVEPGIDYIVDKMEKGQFYVCRKARGVLGEMFDYHRDENGKIVKVDDHYMDAMRYGIFTRVTIPIARARWA